MEETMTSKRRAELKGQANRLKPLFQVGKGGVTDAVIAQTDEVFDTHELIKIKVLLDSAPEKPKEIAEKISAATDSQVVQVIGGSMIFYKYNPELHEETVKKKKAVVKKGTGMGAKDYKKKFAKKASNDRRFSPYSPRGASRPGRIGGKSRYGRGAGKVDG